VDVQSDDSHARSLRLWLVRTGARGQRHLREFDRLGEDLKVIERDLARSALADDGVKRLMTIPGVDIVVALAMVAAMGEVTRFDEP